MHALRPVRYGFAALAVAVATVGCSSSDGDATSDKGKAKQAVEELQGFGLSEDEATCIVDAIGADAIVEAVDLNAFSESQQYQDAAGDCTS